MQASSLPTQYLNTGEQDAHAWVALDDPAEWPAFSEPAGDAQARIWESRIAVEGMHCAACAFAVEKALKSVDGVSSAEVNATSGRARGEAEFTLGRHL